jgi:hypothetical protein
MARPEAIADAALRAVDEQFDATVGATSFEDVVAAAFGGVVWLARQRLPAPLDADSLDGQAISASILDAVIGPVATRLTAAATATGRELTDPRALADTFVRLAHALILVPDPARPLTCRGDAEAYARRFLVPVATAAAHDAPAAPAPAEGPVSLRRRSLRMVPILTLTLFLGSGALAAALVQPWSAPVSPTDSDDRGVAPAPVPPDDGATPIPAFDGSGTGTAGPVTSATGVAPTVSTSVAPITPSPADIPAVDLQPTASPGNNGSRMPAPQGFPQSGAPFGPPPQGSMPNSFAPGVPSASPPGAPRRPGPSPGSAGGPGTPGGPGSGSHPGGHGAGPP